MKKYKHISFDLDGTLVCTLAEYRYKVVPEVVAFLGGKILNEKSVDRFWFEAGRDEIIKNEFNLDSGIFWPVFREKDAAEVRASFSKIYEDTERTLLKLKELGKKISIITGAPHHVAQAEMKKLDKNLYDYYFSVHDSEFNEKPDPASFHYVLKQLDFTPEETLYIGNSNEDALFAAQTGVDFIHLERLEHVLDLSSQARAVIHSLDELFQL